MWGELGVQWAEGLLTRFYKPYLTVKQVC
jgi:hypothetical protein